MQEDNQFRELRSGRFANRPYKYDPGAEVDRLVSPP
jgi:hypothetical protein